MQKLEVKFAQRRIEIHANNEPLQQPHLTPVIREQEQHSEYQELIMPGLDAVLVQTDQHTA
jgi:hypothetical protein